MSHILQRVVKCSSVLCCGELSILFSQQAPVLLSLEETYAQTAMDCAARVLLVSELMLTVASHSSPFCLLFCFSIE